MRGRVQLMGGPLLSWNLVIFAAVVFIARAVLKNKRLGISWLEDLTFFDIPSEEEQQKVDAQLNPAFQKSKKKQKGQTTKFASQVALEAPQLTGPIISSLFSYGEWESQIWTAVAWGFGLAIAGVNVAFSLCQDPSDVSATYWWLLLCGVGFFLVAFSMLSVLFRHSSDNDYKVSIYLGITWAPVGIVLAALPGFIVEWDVKQVARSLAQLLPEATPMLHTPLPAFLTMIILASLAILLVYTPGVRWGRAYSRLNFAHVDPWTSRLDRLCLQLGMVLPMLNMLLFCTLLTPWSITSWWGRCIHAIIFLAEPLCRLRVLRPLVADHLKTGYTMTAAILSMQLEGRSAMISEKLATILATTCLQALRFFSLNVLLLFLWVVWMVSSLKLFASPEDYIQWSDTKMFPDHIAIFQILHSLSSFFAFALMASFVAMAVVGMMFETMERNQIASRMKESLASTDKKHKKKN
jgi:hypothetical protein